MHDEKCLQTITTKQTTIHLNSLITKKTSSYDVRYPGPGFGEAHNGGKVKPRSHLSGSLFSL
jgi:hypothetical protein